MASGLHWEWRGFGGVTSTFANRYSTLPVLIEAYVVDDLYLWIPGLEVNAKLRTNADGDLKFKRIKDEDGNLEQWRENPNEIFNFPLSRSAWETLSGTLETVDIQLPAYPSNSVGRDDVLEYLEDHGCKTIHVKKHRESRLWQGPNGGVQIEWACISAPQSIISIGIEGWSESETDNLPDDLEKQNILAAMQTLNLTNQPLQVMNYQESVQTWAKSEKV